MSTPPAPCEDQPPQVTLRLASHPKRVGHTDYPVKLGPEATIQTVKEMISQWDGQPKADGVLVIVGGRILNNQEKVEDVLPQGVSVGVS